MRRPFIFIALLLAPLIGLPAAKPPAKPNIIFILADDLGFAEIGANGTDYYKTPNIDSLAKTGIRFNHFYTAPNLRRVAYASAAQDTLALEFDQPVVWADTLAGQFYLDGAKDKVASGSVAGNVLTLKLKEPGVAKQITYLKEIAWSQDTLLVGANGLAALTFCEVPIAAAKAAR